MNTSYQLSLMRSKQLMKKSFILLLAMLLSVSAYAHDFEAVNGNGKTIYYNITSAAMPYTVAVTYQGSSYNSYSNEYTGDVVIPETTTYDGITYAITSIGNSAFYGCTSLTSVMIPESVTTIGNRAFSGCTSLTSVTIPNSVTTIAENSFSGCTSLTSITIPESVTTIGLEAFSNCTGLTSITIPESVTAIGNGAFYECTGLTSITIPESVTAIGSGAFYECRGLTSVTIPESVTTIGRGAFYECRGLTSVTIPNSVTMIGVDAFFGCDGLTSVTIPESVTVIEYGVFWKCTGLTSVTIPESVTAIVNRAFANCTGLTSVTIPNSVTTIGDYAFESCTGLTSITIPNSITTIGSGAFYECRGLTSVTIPESITMIGNNAFGNCTALTAIDVASNNNTFHSLDGVLFSNKILLQYPSGKQGVAYTIPESVTTIGNRAFSGCTSLTSVTIPNSVTTIESGAFYKCIGLTSVTIGNSVTTIGDYAFESCAGLTQIICKAIEPPSAGHSYTFYRVDKTTCKLFVPAGSEEAYRAANGWKEFSNISAIPSATVTVPRVRFNHANLSLKPGESESLTMLVNDVSVDIAQTSNWQSSNPAIVTVDNNGVVTSVAQGGQTTITATILIDGSAYTAKCEVYIENLAIVIEEAAPVVDGAGKTEIALEIVHQTPFTGSFEVSLPAGVLLNMDATTLAEEWRGIVKMQITPQQDDVNTWLFTFELNEPTIIAKAPLTRKALRPAVATNSIVDISYTVEEGVDNDFELVINNLALTLEDDDKTEIKRENTIVPVQVIPPLTGITLPTSATSVKAIGYYTIDGQTLDQEPASGLYIIRYADGTAKKIFRVK